MTKNPILSLARLELDVRRGIAQFGEENSVTTLAYKTQPARTRKIINKCRLLKAITKINSEKSVNGK